MAIVNYLGGGGQIDSGAGTRANANMAQQQQQLSQQSLQQRRLEMQNYLDQLPVIAQQRGLRPEEFRIFLSEQQNGIKNALAVLGVPNVEQSFQQMIKEVSVGERLAQGAYNVAEDVTAQRRADMPQGLTGQQQEEYLAFGRPSQTVPGDPIKSTEQVPSTEPPQTTSALDYAKQLQERKISRQDVTPIVDIAKYMQENAVTDEGKSAANRLIMQYNSGDTEIIDDVFKAVTNQYIREVEQGLIKSTETTFTTYDQPKFTIPEGANPRTVEQMTKAPDPFVEGVTRPMEPEYRRMTDPEKDAFIKALATDTRTPSVDDITLARMIMAERGPTENKVIEMGREAMDDITIEKMNSPEFREVLTQTQQTVPGVQGYLTAVEQFRQKANETSPGAGEFVLPKLDQQQQAAQINYLNAQSENLRRQGDTVEAAINAEIQKALIEGNQELFKEAFTQYYKFAEKQIEANMQGLSKAQQAEYLNQFMANFAESISYNNIVADIAEGNIDRWLLPDKKLPLPGAASMGGQQTQGVSSGEALSTLSSQLNTQSSRSTF